MSSPVNLGANSHPVARLENLVKRVTGKDSSELQQAAAADEGRGGQLPLFPEEDTSALPNYLARTPLFAPIQRGPRKIHDRALLASPEGIEVWFTGKQLDMADQDVFMLALKWAQGVDLNEAVRCNRAEFLKALGWTASSRSGAFGKSAYEWLDQSFLRLTSGTLSIKTKRYKAHLSLISDWTQDSETHEWEFTVGGKIRALFQNKEYAFIDLAKRQQIARRVDLAKWLQSYAASHEAGQHRISVAKLKKWCGYSAPTRKFLEPLSEALDELKRVNVIANAAFYRDYEMVGWVRL
jgi:hypothetical protein